MFLVFSWNKRLKTIVNARIGELKIANDSLAESNQQLVYSANQQLKIHDKMQNEFINIASHEMKTPWALNNHSLDENGGRGAVFTFSIPLSQEAN